MNGRAGFRVLGIFDTESKAKKHFKKSVKRKLVQPLPAFVVNLFETNVIPSNASRTVEYLTAKAEQLKADNKTMMEEKKKLFEEKLEKRRKREIDTSEEVVEMMKRNDELHKAKPERSQDDDSDSDEDDTEVKRDAEIRNQQFVAVSCLLDHGEAKEDAFTIYAAFARQDEAKRYVDDTLSDYENSIHLFVCDMYEWLFPYVLEEPGMLKNMPFSYHHDQLNSFMQNKVNQKERVAAYKKIMETHTKKEDGIEIEEVDETGDNETKS
tara:strand:- start:59 stop:859 length:801 start_codon:yes stop_codon:yes gene_type:complete